MDTFFLESVVRELTSRIGAGRIDKIHQPEAEVLVLRLWSGREELRLLLGASVKEPRLHLTEENRPNPFTPPRFCQLLRSRLSRITGVEKVPDERFVYLHCRGHEGEDYRLIAELLGNRANLLLVDGEGRIVDALKRGAGGRDALSGHPYVPPPAPLRHPLSKDLPEIPGEAAEPFAFERWLRAHLAPMSPLVAKDLGRAVALGLSPEEALEQFRQRWMAGDFHPVIGRLEGKRVLMPFAPHWMSLEEREEFVSPSEAADHYYRLAVPAGEGGQRGELREIVRKALRRLESRLGKIAQDRERAGAPDDSRILGELLLANLHLLRRGMEKVTVQNWYADPPEEIVIALDPRLTPQENAERYFRGYKKGKKGEGHVERRIEETEAEIAWLEEVAHAVEEAESREDLEAIRRELEEGGVIRAPADGTPRRREPNPRDALRHALSPGGFHIFWGKNSRTNDYVSREMTAPDDLWFHALGIPGCHLVLKRGGKGEIPEEDILFAASLAAGHSRGKDDTKVEVMVAEGKQVRKPRGARPGLVTVERYRSVTVKPARTEG